MVDGPAVQLDGPVELVDRALVLTALRARITERVVRKGEGRLERHDLLELRDSAIEIVAEVVDVANLRLHLQIERIQPLGLLQLDQGQVVALLE